jgi:anti-anti-sigma regulatory factor
LVIDIEGVPQVSSAMFAVLLRVKRRCLARRVDVVLRQPSGRSVELLRRTGLLGALAIEPADWLPEPSPTAAELRRRGA